jgi:hypothetical protein
MVPNRLTPCGGLGCMTTTSRVAAFLVHPTFRFGFRFSSVAWSGCRESACDLRFKAPVTRNLYPRGPHQVAPPQKRARARSNFF